MFNWQFTTKLFDGFTILRWTDFITPREYVEIEKHATQSILTYIIGKEYEERAKTNLDWNYIVKNNVLGLLSKIATSDIKSTLHARIKKADKNILNNLILDTYFEEKKAKYFADSTISYDEYKEYLEKKSIEFDKPEHKICYFCHKFATYREFCTLEPLNTLSPDIGNVKSEIESALKKFDEYSKDADNLILQKIFTDIRIKESSIYKIFSYFEKLRPQVRWAQTCRLPQTTVLGHSMYVAVLTYFAIRELNLSNTQILVDSFYAALFHDLPESLTRDVISPIKKSIAAHEQKNGQANQNIIAQFEYSEVNDNIISKIGDSEWKKHLEYLIGKEENSGGQNVIEPFEDRLGFNSSVLGKLIEYMDKISAFVEAKMSVEFGINSKELRKGIENTANYLKDKEYNYFVSQNDIRALKMNDFLFTIDGGYYE